jgi:membrane protease YdiL (CAAX protease family)
MSAVGSEGTVNNQSMEDQAGRVCLIWTVAIVTLLVSDFPNVIWHFFQPEPAWLFWVKAAILTVFLGLGIAVKFLHPLRKYAVMLLAFFLVGKFSDWIATSSLWLNWFGGNKAPFAALWSGRQLIQLIFTLIIIGISWVILRKRQIFFLAKGQIDAELEPTRWLGIRKGQRWTSFGWIFAAIFAGGTLLYVILAYGKYLSNFSKILPLIPLAVLFAAINSFTEEFTYRAPLLGTTYELLGKQPALWINAIFFGFAHYLYGTPSGVPGLLMTTLVGYLFGKSMIETRGSFWALLIHMMADIPIFVLYALASVAL